MKMRQPQRRRKLKYLSIIGLVALVVVTVSCREKYLLRFSHRAHVEEREMECVMCHGEMEEGGFSTPDHDICSACHSDWIESEEISQDTCGNCHMEKNLEEIGAEPEEERPVRGVFRHSEQLEGLCDECHGPMVGASGPILASMTRSQVIAWRDKVHEWDMDCVACHDEGTSKTEQPDSHDKNWKKRHGVYYWADRGACTVCHEQETCRQCHQSTKPDNHTILWKNRAHGLQASARREYCLNCHQDDSCDACHREVRPSNHRAGWRRRHCFNCHTTASPDSGCETCHPGGGVERHRDNVDYSFHPDPVTGLNCLICHIP